MDKSFHYVGEVPQSVAKWASSLQVQIRSQIFVSFKSFSILSILVALELTYDRNTVSDVAAFLHLHFFMKIPAAKSCKERIPLNLESYKRQEDRKVASYCDVVAYLLKTLATDDIIAEANSHMMWTSQASTKSSKEYAEAL